MSTNQNTNMTDAPPTYEISSFQDIIEKIPPDRIPVMLNELGDMLSNMAALRNLSLECASQAGMDLPADAITVKLPLVWKDDHRGENKLHVTSEGETLATFTTTAAPEDTP